MDDVKITLDIAYEWLNKSDDVTYLCLSSEELVKHMLQALQERDDSLAVSILRSLQNLSRQMTGSQEVAEVSVACGRAAFCLGYLDDAARLLSRAIDHYHFDQHRQSVVRWMLGYTLWKTPNHSEEWILLWQESLKGFVELARKRGELSSWYTKGSAMMMQDIERAIAQECSSSSAPVPVTTLRLVTKPTSAAIGSTMSWSFPVVDEIQAGDPKVVGFDPTPKSFAKLDTSNQFTIDGHAYRIVNLRPGNIVKLHGTERYTILKVIGDSMDQAGIDDGNYVLLQLVEAADSQDIVAAQIVDVDVRATLKRLVKRNRKILLRPESTNSRHKAFEFTESSQGFYIRGIALAVLKPM